MAIYNRFKSRAKTSLPPLSRSAKPPLPSKSPSLHLVSGVDIDYTQQGSDEQRPAWWPKGESPLIAELVADGQLLPVEQRLGVDTNGDGIWESEPIVMRGDDGVGSMAAHGTAWLNSGDLFIADWRLAGAWLLRPTPNGDRLVPHIAKEVTVNDDARSFTIRLRKGMRWSDGALFTVKDIMYAIEKRHGIT